ncbi:helix-turn-helix domain-containing protein [Geodermatophilus aquaeductus]|uniref:Predicted transcriptional regulator, ArsR family n=1 Tax=Geodermatophilus aquaeductus TaxID=1564161 RepID=A0A521DNM1_9ACTN|nr:helix-turn-helix domain-containing protein [Geodermatophilus aquaeductus]SMO73296.1 Predicted transcriptional regulator, ArsR family [Geodermatophilus aquaeductus]
MDPRAAQVAAVAALAEPTRRRLYEHVARSPHPLSRDDVAGALGIGRPTTAFHLDRLVADGLLDVHYERRSGRTGPGAGRPAKLYRRTGDTVSVSLPERHYDLAGDLLATAVAGAERSGERPAVVLSGEAFRRGRELAAAEGSGCGPEGALRVLERHGFEPREADGEVVLANCPFHVLARAHPELVCGMNLRLVEGVLDGVGEAGLTASLQPDPGACCVRLDRSGRGARTG